jgi:hypothetical protein
MINVVTYPQKTINGQVSEVSKWNAVHHPIQFEIQRQDRSVISATQYSPTQVTIFFNGTFEGIVGDSIYFESGIFKGTGVVAVIGFSGVTSGIIVDFVVATYSVQLGGFLNFVSYRSSYYIETTIFGVDETPAYYEVGTSINKPDATGRAKIDVSAFLKTIVSYQDTFEYNQLNKSDLSQGGQFNIQYREGYNGTTGAWSGISTSNLFYYVNASKQIQQVYGANMGEYVPFDTAFTTEPKAKFLSDFNKPTYFPGFPFSLSFIYSDAIAGSQIVKFEEEKDSNGGVVSTLSFNLDPAYLQQVNRLMLSDDFPCTTEEVDVWLQTDGAVCREYVLADYVAEDYVEELCGVIEVDPGEPR